jgi:hypothetical protein
MPVVRVAPARHPRTQLSIAWRQRDNRTSGKGWRPIEKRKMKIAQASARKRRLSTPTSAWKCGARCASGWRTAPSRLEYDYTIRDGRDAPIIERKEDMKKCGLASPDLADALALTFAYSVVASDHTRQISTRSQHQTEYEPYAAMYRSGRTTCHQARSPSNSAGTRSAYRQR